MDKIKNVAQRLGIITVEDMERYTALELIMMIANKMNDYSDELQDLSDKVHYLLNEGTLAEVIQIFDEWLQDGTFDRLINESALKTVNDRIDETNAQLSEVDKKDINRRIVYVDDFGAKGDGSDDTIAIKKAVEHLAWQINSDATTPQDLNSGGILKFTEGNYKFDDVALPMGTRVEGEGMWNTRITNFTKGKSAFKLEKQTIPNRGAHACIFSNLNIYGGTHNNDIDLAIPVISYDSLTSIMFEQIWTIGTFPIKVANCTEVTFESCIFDESIRHLYLFNCRNVNINNLQCYRSVQQSLRYDRNIPQ